jgi:outer membrane protein OmpA-like peptidoglycan-associated protein
LDGTMTVNPLWTQGRYAATGIDLSHLWEHIKDHVSFQIVKGSTGASGDYTAAMGDAALSARLENGTIELKDFELVEKGRKEVLISIPTAAVQGIGADVEAREIMVETIQTADARIKSWLGEDGQFELQRLFLKDLEKIKGPATSGAPEPEAAPGPPWHVTLKKIKVSGYGLAFEDRTLIKPATMTVDDINIAVENFSTRKDAQADVRVAMQINQAGTVIVDGTAGVDPLTADLTVVSDKIALKPFQPYVDEAVNVHIEGGSTSSNGRIRYLGQDAKPQIRYEGAVSVDGVEIQDHVQAEDFFTLKQLKTSGILLELLPNKVHATEVRIDQPHANITIDQNGVVRVANAFAPAEKRPASGQEDLLQRLVNLLMVQFKGPMPINVDKVLMTNFTADFVDESVSPTFTTNLELTRGTIAGLSSNPSALADFKVDGTIGPSAAIVSTGRMNPMNALKYSQVDFSLTDFGLKPVSPYAGRFVGFKIDEGTLQTELKYKVEGNQVHGDNIIYIDNLELGQKVDSPDAPNLPIKLGVALLKDSDDRITLQVPVSGDVTDPQFDFAQAIQSALTGTVQNAGNSPFGTIAEIDGFRGEELRRIEFQYGFSKLADREIDKLNALAKFLEGRESLTLGIVGTADRKMDWAAILGEPAAPPADDVDAAADPKTDQATAQGGREVDVELLEKLAQRRAEQVAQFLTQQAGVAADRIEVNPIQIKPTPEGAAATATLSLFVP